MIYNWRCRALVLHLRDPRVQQGCGYCSSAGEYLRSVERNSDGLEPHLVSGIDSDCLAHSDGELGGLSDFVLGCGERNVGFLHDRERFGECGRRRLMARRPYRQ